VGPVVAVVAIELVACRKTLVPVVTSVEFARDLGNRQRGALEVDPVAVSASGQVSLRIVRVSVYPNLADGMDSVRPAIRRHRDIAVTCFAFGNAGRISLKLLGIDVVIGLQGWKLCMRRPVTSGAIYAAVTGTEAVQIGSRNGYVRVGGKGLIRHHAPVPAIVKRSSVALAVLVAQLAGRLDEPGVAHRVASIGQRAMTLRAQNSAHRAALALSNWSRMAQVAGIRVALLAVLIQGQAVGLKNLRSMQSVHVAGLSSDAG